MTTDSIIKALNEANQIRAIYSLMDTVFDSIDLGDKNRTATLLMLLDDKLEPAIDSLVELLQNALAEEIAREREKVCGALVDAIAEIAPQTLGG